MEKKLCGVLMAFGASEAAMNNDDYFQNGKNICEVFDFLGAFYEIYKKA